MRNALRSDGEAMKQRSIKAFLCTLCAAVTLCGGCASSDVPPISAQTAATQMAAAQTTAAQTTAAQTTAAPRQSGVGFYFDTVVTVTLYGADDTLLEDLWALCGRYEQLLSRHIPGSDVDRINTAHGQTVTVDPDTYAILAEAKEISEATGHAFSITIAPVAAMWDFTGGTARMPGDEERLAALALIDDSAIALGEGCAVTLPDGMQLDLGGIAKGYIADRVAELARDRCSGMVLSLGGNTYVTGCKPGGAMWNVGVQDPEGSTGSSLAVLSLADGTVVTSGIYERYFILDGVRYHHILDPKTGISAMTDLASATVLGVSSMRADALATACIVLGSGESLALLERMGADGLLITRDGVMLETPGFSQKYQLRNMKSSQ